MNGCSGPLYRVQWQCLFPGECHHFDWPRHRAVGHGWVVITTYGIRTLDSFQGARSARLATARRALAGARRLWSPAGMATARYEGIAVRRACGRSTAALPRCSNILWSDRLEQYQM
jgi:hypothetical protein